MCLALFGAAAPRVFSELLVLLPEVPLQQNLLAAARAHAIRQPGAAARAEAERLLNIGGLTTCPACGQVSAAGDAAAHQQAAHAPQAAAVVTGLADAFPSLGPTQAARPIVAARLPIVKAKAAGPNAWGK